jgi:hypothetical protein
MPFRVRSPYFLSQSGGLSQRLEITIDGVLRYTLFKNTTDGLFDISELCRDYLNISYGGTLSTTPMTNYMAEVEVQCDIYSVENGTGTGDVFSGIILDNYAVDGYNYYDEDNNGVNPGFNAILISNDTLWYPENTTGSFYYVNSSGNTLLTSFGATDTTKITPGNTVYIKRFPCNKYTPVKLVFINKFGMPQELYFFAKNIKSMNTTKNRYKSNVLTNAGRFTEEDAQIKTFHNNGSISYTLHTDYITEDYNEFIQELMLSEQVWASIEGSTKPVIVSNNSVTYKTSLNDKLVNYQIDITQANDLISTMR